MSNEAVRGLAEAQSAGAAPVHGAKKRSPATTGGRGFLVWGRGQAEARRVLASRSKSYMPMPPCGAWGCSSSFLGFSAMQASVVIINEATEAAFCSAVRTTFVGSITPALTRSS